MTENTRSMTIKSVKFLRYSPNGNPFYRVTFSDGSVMNTAKDSQSGYDVQDSSLHGRPVLVTVNGRGTISRVLHDRGMTGPIWVCPCCTLSHANGECCADDSHGGDGIEPWAKLPEDMHPTMGILNSDHECGDPESGECDCERITFSTSQCDGCGSYLHGERHGFYLWNK